MAGRDFHNIFEIYKRDFSAVVSNPIVLLVIIALLILPSLYALLNIDACWDPYENTGEVQFAIANLDNGSSYEGTKINVGNQLVEELKNNDKFDWQFVSEKELRDGVHSGKYYAGIIIPRNTSENILSILSDDPHQAKLEYLVNIKSNPVATKLTDSGANAVYTSLNAKIVEIIDLAAYDKLGELQDGLAAGASQLSGGGSQLQAASSQISSGAAQVSSASQQVSSGASQVQSGASQVQSGVSEVQSGANSVKQASSQVKSGANQVQKGSEELESAVDPSLLPEGPVKEYASSSSKLADGSSAVADGASKLADGSVGLADGSSKLASASGDVANGASRVAGGSVELAEGSLALAAGSQLISSAATQALFTAAASLASSAESLASITGVNETILGEYFYSPVVLERNEEFPVPNYGSDVAPFYLVLSMWVGGIITLSMLRPGIAKGTPYSPVEMYYGKMLLFVTMSFLQATVTLIGCFILGIYIDNVPLFIFSVYLVSIIFMVFVYSLVSALGEIGKALAIILLVFQISGTGGIYPVEIMSHIFQALNPLLPMTYAITLIRESQLGLIWANYLPALAILLGILAATMIVMIIIKEKADDKAHYFEKSLEDSGLF